MSFVAIFRGHGLWIRTAFIQGAETEYSQGMYSFESTRGILVRAFVLRKVGLLRILAVKARHIIMTEALGLKNSLIAIYF